MEVGGEADHGRLVSHRKDWLSFCVKWEVTGRF